MGLAGPKKKTKISNDPNNTNWSKNTDRFGHRVLVSQGWVPGQTLGAAESEYASRHHTAASASHVRVLLREDNWGLGAVRGKADGETFGLEVLSGLLGRLNGKSEDQLDKEAAAMRDVKLMRYQNDKYGRMGFVFGGYLIGEDIKDSIDREIEETDSDKKQKKIKKRKRGEPETSTDADNSNNASVSQKHSDLSELVKHTEPEQQALELAEEKRKRKEEKKARKEERRLRKEQKRPRKAHAKDKSETDSQNQDVSEHANDRNEESTPTTATQSGASTPMFSGGRGRHVIRQRYIQQKKMACLDEKALNEIFMIKSKG